MLKSMTAYGRASFQSKVGHFVAEIQSVNRKFLEINAQLPKELSRFDAELKKWILSHVSRGNITLKIWASFDEMIPVVVHPNLPLARQLKKAWDLIAEELNVPLTQFDLSLLSSEEELITFEENLQDENLYRNALKSVVELAMQGFLQMKKAEGSVLQEDISERLSKTRIWVKAIEVKAPSAPAKYREKLIARLEEFLVGSNIEHEERILREVAIFAEKVDITEEVIRFFCHLNHAEELLNSNESVGKTLEFVLQELGREINTIGSKSSDLEIARLVIDIKSELERIREQIQNVE